MIGFVVTEHPSRLDAEQWQRHRRAAALIGRVASAEVALWPYLECDAATWRCHGIVLSGSSAPWASHRAQDLVALGAALRAYGGPVLGICAGIQLLACSGGGAVGPAAHPESGFVPVRVEPGSALMAGLPEEALVWEQHGDEVTAVPPGARVVARNANCAVQALEFTDRPWWGTQFHPELADDAHPDGWSVLANALALFGEAQAG